jgi:hypothetical protein
MLRTYATVAIAASIAITSCASDPVAGEKAEWVKACKTHEDELKGFVGKTVWFNPIGQLGDYRENPNKYPVPFSETNIVDVSVKCVPALADQPEYQPGEGMYKHLYDSPPDNQDAIFTVSDGEKKWPITFHPNFTQDPDNLDSVLLPWNPKVKYPKVRWKMEIDLLRRGKYRLGISKDELIFMRGHPTEINTTDVTGNHNEQWVYEGTDSEYFYFDNGKLTVIQQ